MGMKLLSAEESKKNAFEGNKWMSLDTLDEKAWQDFLSEFNQRVNSKTTLEDFKKEIWNTVVKFGEPVFMGTRLDEKARKELLGRMIKLRGSKQKTKDDACKDSSTLNKKTDDKMIQVERDDHPVISHLTASLWFRRMDLTITSSNSEARGPSSERKNVAAAEKQLESTGYCFTQERGRWPFLNPRLENATDKTRESAPPLIKQIWKFLEGQLELAENREMTVARFVTAANEVTIGGSTRRAR